MQSTYLKFYLTEKQKHGNQLLYEWLFDQAKHIGVSGGSVFRSIAGFGGTAACVQRPLSN
jgi:PII-like signaling protein